LQNSDPRPTHARSEGWPSPQRVVFFASGWARATFFLFRSPPSTNAATHGAQVAVTSRRGSFPALQLSRFGSFAAHRGSTQSTKHCNQQVLLESTKFIASRQRLNVSFITPFNLGLAGSHRCSHLRIFASRGPSSHKSPPLPLACRHESHGPPHAPCRECSYFLARSILPSPFSSL
jgi:hypothetical protein